MEEDLHRICRAGTMNGCALEPFADCHRLLFCTGSGSAWSAHLLSLELLLLVQEAFTSLDQSFTQQQEREWAKQQRRKGEAAGRRSWPGCTAIAALLHHGHLWVANAGVARPCPSAHACRQTEADNAVVLTSDLHAQSTSAPSAHACQQMKRRVLFWQPSCVQYGPYPSMMSRCRFDEQKPLCL